jgi:hypothetical protein
MKIAAVFNKPDARFRIERCLYDYELSRHGFVSRPQLAFVLAPRDGEDAASLSNYLDCLADANAPVDAKGLFGLLPNRTGPPHCKIESPAVGSRGASEQNDPLAGAIDKWPSRLATQPQKRKSAGPPCPRCRRPMQIRQHDKIRRKQRRQPFYYSRWYLCTHSDCPTTLVMPREFRVFAADGQSRPQA